MKREIVDWNARADLRKPLFGRLLVYTILILLFAAALPWMARVEDAAAFRENGLVEWLQLGLLVSIASIFARESRFSYRLHRAYIVLACLAAFAAVREMNGFLDLLVPFVGWKIAYVFIIYAALIYHWNRRFVSRQMRELVESNGFFLLWAGFIIAIPFAQLVGNTAFLQAIMADDYSRNYRRIIEELGELMGYGLIFIGSIELTNYRSRNRLF